MATKVIVLTSGTTWTVPADWNSLSNTIETIGGGGAGVPSNNTSSEGFGGAGGAYAKSINIPLTKGATVTIAVGAGGTSGTINAAANGGGDTYIANTNSGVTAITSSGVICGAKGAGPATSTSTPGTPGQASASVAFNNTTVNGSGTVKTTGGAAGAFASSGGGGDGGGGASGPNGIGGAGGTPSGTTGEVGGAGGGGNSGGGAGGNAATGTPWTGGVGGTGYPAVAGGAGGTGNVTNGPGGAGSSGSGGGGGGGNTTVQTNAGAGGNGSMGSEWLSSLGVTYGSGSGGGGAGNASTGQPGNGGLYGGGGGGSGGTTSTLFGTGGQGIIVITYTSSAGWPFATDPNPVAFTPTSRLQQMLATQLGQSHTIFARAQGLVKPPNPQYDWPNPLSARERVRNVNLLTHISVDLPIKPPPTSAKPFSQTDWQNPFLPPNRRVWDVDYTYETPLPLPAGAIPFNQMDWPNPLSKGFYQDLRTFIWNSAELFPPAAGINFYLQTGDAADVTAITANITELAFAQLDWPNPPPAKRVVDLLTSIYSPLPAGARPFSQYDWPIPQPPKQNHELRSWIRNWKPIEELVVRPFSQLDWPLPFPPRANLELRVFFQFPETLKPVPLSVVLNTSDAADTSAFAISIAQPGAPSNLVQVQNIQQPGGGGLMPSADAWQFRDYDQVITWKQAEAIVEKWYDDGGFRWLEERSIKEMRPSERAYLQDSLTQSKDMRFLFNHGYSLQEVYRLIDIVKKKRGDEDDGEAIALLLH